MMRLHPPIRPSIGLLLALAAGGCQVVSGLSDYQVADGTGGGATATASATSASSATASSASTGPGGAGGAGGADCSPSGDEICGNGIDEDCDQVDCSDAIWARLFEGASIQVPSAIAWVSPDRAAIAGSYLSGAIDLGGELPESVGNVSVFYALLDTEDGAPVWSWGVPDGTFILPRVAADGAGQVHLTGRYADELVLPDGTELSSNGAEDLFLVSIDDAGEMAWGISLGGVQDEVLWDVAVVDGDPVISGSFVGSIALGTFTLNTAAGDRDGFVARVDAMTGAVVAAAKVSGSLVDAARTQEIQRIAAAGEGLVISGSFVDAVNLVTAYDGSGPGVFIASLDAALVPQWQRIAKSDGQGTSLSLDAITAGDDRIVVAGRFAGSWDLGDGVDSEPFLIGSGGRGVDLFVASLTVAGELEWVRELGDATDQAWGYALLGLDLDTEGNVTLAAGFRGAIDPGTGEELEATGDDWLLLSLDRDGEHRWSRQAGDGAGDQGASAIAFDPASGDLLVAGSAAEGLDLISPRLEVESSELAAVVARIAD